MRKFILSLALIETVGFMSSIVSMKNQDSPNDKIRYKKTSIEEKIDEEMKEEIGEASILVEDEVKPKCKCVDEQCHKNKDKDKCNEKNKLEEKSNDSKKVED